MVEENSHNMQSRKHCANRFNRMQYLDKMDKMDKNGQNVCIKYNS